MIRFTRISLVFCGSALLALVGCQNRAPSLRMLDARAGYDRAAEDEEVGLYQRGRFNDATFARRSAPRVARVWVYPMNSCKDYFWGGYVSLIVSEDTWVFDGEAGNEEIPDAISDPSEKEIKK